MAHSENQKLYIESHINFLNIYYQAIPIVDRLINDHNYNCINNTLECFDITSQDKFQAVSEVMHSSHLQMSAIYWITTAWFLLNGNMELPMRESVWSFIRSCFTLEGGFSPFPGDDAHLLSTYSAIQLCILYNFNIDEIKNHAKQSVINYIQSLQMPDGSFKGDIWGEVDTRFSYCAIASMSLLGNDAIKTLNLDKAAMFIKECCNFDGCYGTTPGSESHSGQIFCCVAALYIIGKLDEQVDIPRLGAWLAQRQHDSEGGLNGRPEKLQDVCYSWWVLSSLTMIQRQHWINRESLISFILSCQDDKRGGFSDRPGDTPDAFHTLFAITGLSLLGYDNSGTLQDIDPVYCLPKKALENKQLSQ